MHLGKRKEGKSGKTKRGKFLILKFWRAFICVIPYNDKKSTYASSSDISCIACKLRIRSAQVYSVASRLRLSAVHSWQPQTKGWVDSERLLMELS